MTGAGRKRSIAGANFGAAWRKIPRHGNSVPIWISSENGGGIMGQWQKKPVAASLIVQCANAPHRLRPWLYGESASFKFEQVLRMSGPPPLTCPVVESTARAQLGAFCRVVVQRWLRPAPSRAALRNSAREVPMGKLRDYWLELLSACVTAALLGMVYTVLAGYAAGPPLGLQHTAAQDPGITRHAAAGPALR